jgi:hypothetical protein
MLVTLALLILDLFSRQQADAVRFMQFSTGSEVIQAIK